MNNKMTPRMVGKYIAIMQQLEKGRCTAQDLVDAIGLSKTNIYSILVGMVNKGYVDKHLCKDVVRRVEYSAEVPISVVLALQEKPVEEPVVKVEVGNKNPHVRTIYFTEGDLQDKLVAQSRLTRLERKSKPVHIGSSWGIM